MFDGNRPVVGGMATGSMYASYLPIVVSELGSASPLAITAGYTLVGTAGYLNVRIEATAPVTTTDNWVHLVVTENGAHGETNLARLVLADVPLTLAAAGESVEFQRTFAVDPAWVAASVRPVVFVQSHAAGRQVLQAACATPRYAATIEVAAAPAALEAPWHLDGPDGLATDGIGSRTLRVFAAGTYTLTWQPLPGWTTPVPAVTTLTVGEGGTIVFAGTYAGGPFTPLAAGPLGAVGPARAVAWADHDGDGDQDLFVANAGQPSRLLRNDGAGAFTDAAPAALAAAGPATGAAWGDFNNDGRPDLCITQDGAANRLLRNDGAGAFTDVAAGSLVAFTGASRAPAWGDYDRDGKLDLSVVVDGAPNKVWRGFGDPGIGQWLLFDTSFESADATNDAASTWLDCDNNGVTDLYVVHRFSASRLFQNAGSFGFQDVAAGTLLANGANGQASAWADFDNDGDLDVYLVNDGQADLLLRNDLTGFSLVIGGPLGDTGHGRDAAWGDYDNDGDLDLHVTRYGQQDLLLRNDGGGVFTAIQTGLAETGGAGVAAAWADADGDGVLDLYRVQDGGAAALLLGKAQPGRHWLQVTLSGGFAVNRSALGARVRVVAGGRTQLRAIGLGGGRGAQNALTAHFGLGTATVVDTLQVRWTDGAVDTWRRVQADDRLVLSHDPPTGLDGPPPVPAVLALHPAAPNPFNPRTTLRFDLPAAGRARLVIHDAAGRRVRALVDAVLAAGPHAVAWNGRDDRHADVASGLYFARLEQAGRVAVQRLMLVR